jgi:hypothetical protein
VQWGETNGHCLRKSETAKLMAYHCAEKDNSDGAGYHDCIAT